MRGMETGCLEANPCGPGRPPIPSGRRNPGPATGPATRNHGGKRSASLSGGVIEAFLPGRCLHSSRSDLTNVSGLAAPLYSRRSVQRSRVPHNGDYAPLSRKARMLGILKRTEDLVERNTEKAPNSHFLFKAQRTEVLKSVGGRKGRQTGPARGTRLKLPNL